MADGERKFYEYEVSLISYKLSQDPDTTFSIQWFSAVLVTLFAFA